ncbi:MAG TPA: Sua5 family C-terminal domain-containing protein, partial [Longimicrobiaceae bacterium]|nr:Sua5 family C-terminal domain-containing protein [Longimicrobiaceae bacterium]
VGIESTVLSLAGRLPTLLRPGTVSIEELRDAVGEVALPSSGAGGAAARPSPGMLDRHYAPRAEVRLFDGSGFPAPLAEGGRTAVLLIRAATHPAGEVVRMPADAREYAARLYATLHRLDDEGFERILVEQPPDTPEWAGVRDRLRRAAHPG